MKNRVLLGCNRWHGGRGPVCYDGAVLTGSARGHGLALERLELRRGAELPWRLLTLHDVIGEDLRAVDRVRSEEASTAREVRAYHVDPPFDEVSDAVVDRLQAERVRHCLDSLTDLQRDAVQAAYYRGYTYREVAELLMVPLGTIKARLRDALIRLRDCLGVDW